MFGRRIPLFKLFGFQVKIELSWLLFAILIVWSLATGQFPSLVGGLSSVTYWWLGVVGALGLFGSIILHEFSHSLVALHDTSKTAIIGETLQTPSFSDPLFIATRSSLPPHG